MSSHNHHHFKMFPQQPAATSGSAAHNSDPVLSSLLIYRSQSISHKEESQAAEKISNQAPQTEATSLRAPK